MLTCRTVLKCGLLVGRLRHGSRQLFVLSIVLRISCIVILDGLMFVVVVNVVKVFAVRLTRNMMGRRCAELPMRPAIEIDPLVMSNFGNFVGTMTFSGKLHEGTGRKQRLGRLL